MKEAIQELMWIKNEKIGGGEGHTWESQTDVNEEETSILIDSEERSHNRKSVKFNENTNGNLIQCLLLLLLLLLPLLATSALHTPISSTCDVCSSE